MNDQIVKFVECRKGYSCSPIIDSTIEEMNLLGYDLIQIINWIGMHSFILIFTRKPVTGYPYYPYQPYYPYFPYGTWNSMISDNTLPCTHPTTKTINGITQCLTCGEEL